MQNRSFSVQTLWGEQMDDISTKDIPRLILKTRRMDDGHGAFWVSNDEDDLSLEVHQDLTVILNLGEATQNDELRYKAVSWAEVEKLYEVYLKEGSKAVQLILSAN